MIKIVIVGGNGQMGRMLADLISDSQDLEVMDTIDVDCIEKYDTLPGADVLLDFSRPASLPDICRYIRRTGTALVSGTTGYNEAEMNTLYSLSDCAPVLYSANYSLGIAVFRKILTEITPVLKDSFDIELTETHHHRKADAPSGTAKALLSSIDPNGEYTVLCGREGNCGARSKNEIGVHSLRGGTISGIHTVSFFGEDETIEITHTAASRKIFALGAINAARKLAGKVPGCYQLEELLFPDI